MRPCMLLLVFALLPAVTQAQQPPGTQPWDRPQGSLQGVVFGQDGCVEVATVQIVAGQGVGRYAVQSNPGYSAPCDWDYSGFSFSGLTPDVP